jgi:3-dehydroquinate synthase
LQRLRVRTKARQHDYEIKIRRGILGNIGDEARACLGADTRRIAVISNQRVFDLYGKRTIRSLGASNFSVSHMIMGDGERFKFLGTAEQTLAFLSSTGLERTDAVLALGGGVVGDLAGFAAAVYLRGIPFVQVPTTLLAQIDSSVGGKTGVNLSLGKNLVGSFHQPNAVLIDIETLTSLPARELVAGWCESVKQGAVASRKLFKKTTAFLHYLSSHRTALVSPKLEELIASHCAFKAAIVAGDEREAAGRRDHRSRRILNFGHTVGHALEAATSYRRFRHGEAVGHGILVAGQLSKNLGLLDASELESLGEAVRLCGPLPRASDIDETAIMSSVARDKKSVNGRIQWVLLERIGRARIVDGTEITQKLLRISLRAGLSKTWGDH